MDSENNIIKSSKNTQSTAGLVRRMGLYTSVSIIGPLLLIGGLGYWLDSYLGTKPILTIIAVFIAFIVTNFLLFKKTMVLMRKVNEISRQAREEQAASEDK